MKKLIRYLFFCCTIGTFIVLQSCEEEAELQVFPLSADIFHSVSDKQVAFTALTHSAVTWSWDFGDGQTSNEENPVHIYDEGGYYVATLTATDSEGNTATADVNLAIALTPYALLTGDHTKPDYDGKTWKLSQAHSLNDKLVNPDANFTLLDEDIEYLPTGAFDLYLGLKEAYNDEFTFYNDGSYRHDTKDGSSFGGIVFAMVMQQFGLSTITETGGEAVFGADAFALSTYTPEENATFTFVENEDFSIPTIPNFATGVNSLNIPIVTYPGVMTIDFQNSTEFVGIKDFHRKVIVEEITDNSMRLVMFLTLSPDAIVSQDPLIALSTTAMILSFEVVE
ncbi:PKD domain-containing protein [Maribellus maritimus]|uniref:PKD domain-containing protein n=1 Tax=Maribellus maritimus TaxID=2870838 RepID=UPI001EEA68B8|nr:PKD domain-containing protein [Maribellus maritimus]MCG6188061.1 PKD domain-containing protein [Maribellus maritimus]